MLIADHPPLSPQEVFDRVWSWLSSHPRCGLDKGCFYRWSHCCLGPEPINENACAIGCCIPDSLADYVRDWNWIRTVMDPNNNNNGTFAERKPILEACFTPETLNLGTSPFTHDGFLNRLQMVHDTISNWTPNGRIFKNFDALIQIAKDFGLTHP